MIKIALSISILVLLMVSQANVYNAAFFSMNNENYSAYRNPGIAIIMAYGKDFSLTTKRDLSFEKAQKSELKKGLWGYLLFWLQNAPNYKADDNQFGIKEHIYPTEILPCAYSYREYRSILCSYLFKDLASTGSIGLKHSDYVASAFRPNVTIEGDLLQIGEACCVVASQTNINALLGSIVPKTNNCIAGIIKTTAQFGNICMN
jgi:hypothetical protein